MRAHPPAPSRRTAATSRSITGADLKETALERAKADAVPPLRKVGADECVSSSEPRRPDHQAIREPALARVTR